MIKSDLTFVVRHRGVQFFRHSATTLVALLSLLTVSATALASNTVRAYFDDGNIQTSHPDWMSRIPDDTRLGALSIPGTHDSAAYESYFGFTSSNVYTQSLDLEKQLNAGIRYVDIRARHIAERFAIHHGAFHLDPGGVPLFFDAVLTTLNNFLEAHLTETIVMRLGGRGTSGPESPGRTYGETYAWYRDVATESEI
jgi:1-phosphatidylinositol phosphodiesterase